MANIEIHKQNENRPMAQTGRMPDPWPALSAGVGPVRATA
jgi:hypothetical protein